jgi:hypothetical protein
MMRKSSNQFLAGGIEDPTLQTEPLANVEQTVNYRTLITQAWQTHE